MSCSNDNPAHDPLADPLIVSVFQMKPQRGLPRLADVGACGAALHYAAVDRSVCREREVMNHAEASKASTAAESQNTL